ncbi:MAG: polyprenol monophosphomannose synthase [Actinomycetaceae bacterium]|nr:polyprenol monophosphomannose synthase [Actinomycetaceae bacterium]
MTFIDQLNKVIVAVPTYNERESLPIIIRRIRQAVPPIHILIVDDASPDGTGELADALAEKDEHLHVLHRSAKEGLGPAYLHAFSWAQQAGYQWVGQMDADGSHRPEQFLRLLSRAIKAPDQPELVIGSRWTRGGAVNGWARHRELLSRGANTYIALWLGLGVGDATAGFRLYRVSLFDRLDLSLVNSAGYCFQIEMTRRARHVGATIAEVPITFDEREHGVSKMSGNIITEALTQVTKWGMVDRYTQLKRLLGVQHTVKEGAVAGSCHRRTL